jgi:GT2 family glycosyltransferase
MQNRKVVYTAVTGNYDSLKTPSTVEPGWDYVCFTDNFETKSDFWDVRCYESDKLIELGAQKAENSRRLSKFFKMHPHLLLSEYDESLWIDASLRIKGSIDEYVRRYLKKSDMLCLIHPDRNCIYEEAYMCIDRGLTVESQTLQQIERYRNEGLPEGFGMPVGGIIYRKHTQTIEEFNALWYQETMAATPRDQLSFVFCCWKLALPFDFSYCDLFDNPYFEFYRHTDAQQNKADAKLYVETDNSPFSEENAICLPLAFPDNWFDVNFKFPETIGRVLRLHFDPATTPVKVKIDSATIINANDEEQNPEYVDTTSIKETDDFHYFATFDSKYLFDFTPNGIIAPRSVRFVGEIEFLNDKEYHLLAENQVALSERDASLTRLQSELSERNASLTRLQSELSERDASLTRLQSELSERNASLTRFQLELLERDNELYRENIAFVELRQRFAESQEALNDILTSTTWRVTKPLRKIIGLMQRIATKVFEGTQTFVPKDEISANQATGVKYCIDSAKYENDVFSFEGWIFDPESMLDLKLQINTGKEHFSFEIPNRIPRADVADAFQNQFGLQSGISICVVIKNSASFTARLAYTARNGKTGAMDIGTFSKGSRGKFDYFKSKLTLSNIRTAMRLIRNGKLNYVISKLVKPSVKLYDNNVDDGKVTDIAAWLRENIADAPDLRQIRAEHADIIVPIYNGYKHLNALFDTIKNTDLKYKLIVIDDCSSDERILPLLEERLSEYENTTLLKNDVNMGFVKTVNRGLGLIEHNVVILNSDIVLPENWLERLIAPIIESDKVASVTPFSNSATICSFPNFCEDNELLFGLSCNEIDRVFSVIKPKYTEMPSGVGFCMAMSHNAIQTIGLFDDKTFGKGYGEENDWCQRAIKRGFINVIAENLFVFHNHGGSFEDDEKKQLMSKHLDLLNDKHPRYGFDVRMYIEADPVRNFRNYVLMRICGYASKYTVLYLTHNWGGGAEAYLEKKKRDLLKNNKNVIIVRYIAEKNRYIFSYAFQESGGQWMFSTFSDILTVLKLLPIKEIYINALVGYPEIYKTMKIIVGLRDAFEAKLTYLLHDYFCICPTIVLLDVDKKFCGLKDCDKCDKCLSKNLLNTRTDYESMRVWRDNWGEFLGTSDKIIAFSNSSTELLGKCYTDLPTIEVVPHKVDYLFEVHREHKTTHSLNIGVLGDINEAKGFNIIKDMLGIIKNEDLDIRIILLGSLQYPMKDPRLICGGRYSPSELPELILRHDVDLFLMPSVWPETFSYTTEEIMRMGYPIAVFDIGAPAERVRTYPKGTVVGNTDARAALETIQMLWDSLAPVGRIGRRSNVVPSIELPAASNEKSDPK